MLTVKLKYVYQDIDRHGNVRTYFWRGKCHPKIRLRASTDTPEFRQAYDEALAASVNGASTFLNHHLRQPAPGTLRWLCVAYMRSAEFGQLHARTRHVRKLIIDRMLQEPIAPNAAEIFADFPVSRLTAKAVRVLRDRKAHAPHAANKRLKALRRVFAWAIEENLTVTNPVRDVASLKIQSRGFHSWTIEEVEQYEHHHHIGSRARLALALLLYTGQRRSDVVQFGPQHVRDGWLRFTQVKNRARKPVALELPILPVLADVLARSSLGKDAFLVTEQGRPFTSNGFGNRMRKWCDAAGLHHCTAHGLRKAGAAIAAENGATENQLMAIFGWVSPKEAARYTRAARQKKIARGAMHLLLRNSIEQ